MNLDRHLCSYVGMELYLVYYYNTHAWIAREILSSSLCFNRRMKGLNRKVAVSMNSARCRSVSLELSHIVFLRLPSNTTLPVQSHKLVSPPNFKHYYKYGIQYLYQRIQQRITSNHWGTSVSFGKHYVHKSQTSGGFR